MDEFYILKEAAESLWKDLRKIFTFSIFSRSICYIFSQSMTCQFGQQMTLLSSLETCHELVIKFSSLADTQVILNLEWCIERISNNQ